MSARLLVIVLMPLLAGGCALAPHAEEDAIRAGIAADVLLLGEQHDAPAHQRSHQRVVQALGAQGRLAALALEMAEQGASTAGLPPGAGVPAVQAALRWNEQAWPWAAYGPAVMSAVAAGVPVLGANLPRTGMRAAMADATLDTVLAPPALQSQREAIRSGHCDMLPASQIAPMTRIQIARDRAMAATLAAAAVGGKTVVLLAGAGHVRSELGVPVHLPPHLRAHTVAWPAQPSGVDHCARLREQLKPAAAS